MRTIWKYVLRTPKMGAPLDALAVGQTQTLGLPAGAEVVRVGAQVHGGLWRICLWALVDTDADVDPRDYLVIPTGRPVPDGYHYIGSAQTHGNHRVWHVFEEGSR